MPELFRRRRDARTTRRARVLAFLNTAFGLWLLSTIAVGLTSTGYGLLSAALAERAKQRTQLERLHIEVRQRVIQLSGMADAVFDAPGRNPDLSSEEAALLVSSLLAPPSASANGRYPIYAAFDEFKERPLVSLMVEIVLLLGPKASAEVTPDIASLSALTHEKLKGKTAKELQQLLEDMFFSPYWTNWEKQH